MSLFGTWQPPKGGAKVGKIGGKIEGIQIRTPPPITDWKRPAVLPDLRSANIISLDVETWDPDINSVGANGFRRGTAHIAGISIKTDNKLGGYFPIRHPESDNFDPAQVLGPKGWLSAQLSRPGQIKVGANLLYDLDALTSEGCTIEGPFHDVQIAEPLLDENRGVYNLDSLGEQYLGYGKNEDAMVQYLAQRFNVATNKAKNYIAKAPASIVGPYAEVDSAMALDIINFQYPKLEVDALYQLFELECDLIPMMLAMRQRGVAVDLDAAERLRNRLTNDIRQAEDDLKRAAGVPVGIWESDSIARAFDALSITYPRTKRGAPSFRQEWLEAHQSPVAAAIVKARKAQKMRDTFVVAYILEGNFEGRIYANFHQMKGDENGTVSGRFSSSSPNLQNIPTRDPDYGKPIRSCFIPDEGKLWWKLDWSQIEYRLIAHYAVLLNMPGGKALADSYRNDPTIDYHKMVADMTGLPRPQAKNLNFGLAYGMGLKLLANKLKISPAEAEPILKQYHQRAPFVKALTNHFKREADNNGYVVTMLGRRRRYDLWEPNDFELSKNITPLSRDLAERMLQDDPENWGRKGIRRAYTYAALNGVIQGSAADLMKYAMREIWNSNVIDSVGVPQLTVHDELDGSMDPGQESVLEDIRAMMQDCIKLEVPVLAEGGVGPNWGTIH